MILSFRLVYDYCDEVFNKTKIMNCFEKFYKV